MVTTIFFSHEQGAAIAYFDKQFTYRSHTQVQCNGQKYVLLISKRPVSREAHVLHYSFISSSRNRNLSHSPRGKGERGGMGHHDSSQTPVASRHRGKPHGRPKHFGTPVSQSRHGLAYATMGYHRPTHTHAGMLCKKARCEEEVEKKERKRRRKEQMQTGQGTRRPSYAARVSSSRHHQQS